MPTKTFFNLPVEKKERVVEAALTEFAAHSFHQASVTRIIEGAGIASGSFYQYFVDKKDLYKYIINCLGEKKLEYLNPMLEKFDQLDFFDLLRELYLGGIRFARENPRLEAIGDKLINSNERFLNDVIGDQLSRGIDFFENLIQQGIAKGSIDPEIDPRLMARILTDLNLQIGKIIYEDGRIDMDDMVVIDKLLYFIKNGISKKE